MSIHWLWWEHSLTRLNSAFVNTPSAVQTTFIKSIRISQLCIDRFLKHLQVSCLLRLLGESLRSHFKRNHLAISCDVIVWFWHLAAVHEAHLLGGFLGTEWEISLVRALELTTWTTLAVRYAGRILVPGSWGLGKISENSGTWPSYGTFNCCFF